MNDNFCPNSEITELDYSRSQIETGIYELEFDSPEQNPWRKYKYFVMVGGGYRGFVYIRDARKYYNEDF